MMFELYFSLISIYVSRSSNSMAIFSLNSTDNAFIDFVTIFLVIFISRPFYDLWNFHKYFVKPIRCRPRGPNPRLLLLLLLDLLPLHSTVGFDLIDSLFKCVDVIVLIFIIISIIVVLIMDISSINNSSIVLIVKSYHYYCYC